MARGQYLALSKGYLFMLSLRKGNNSHGTRQSAPLCAVVVFTSVYVLLVIVVDDDASCDVIAPASVAATS